MTGRCKPLSGWTRANSDEIEITPAMERAGIDALNALDVQDIADGWVSKRDAVSQVFSAMVRAAMSG